MEIVGLKGELVRLVPPDKTLHLENALRWWNDPTVTYHLISSLGMTRGMGEEWFERVQNKDRIHTSPLLAPAGVSNEFAWSILDETERHIGFSFLHNINWRNRSGVTGTIIGEKDAWGKGYGSDSMRVRAKFAFEVLGLHRLDADAFAENTGSQRALEKAGYKREGVARRKMWHTGRWHDLILYGLLDEEYFHTKDEARSAD